MAFSSMLIRRNSPKPQAGSPGPTSDNFQSDTDSTKLILQTLNDGVAAAPILADSVYGDSAEFRDALRQWGLDFLLQVTPTAHKGWTERVQTERKRNRHYLAAVAPPGTHLTGFGFHPEGAKLETLPVDCSRRPDPLHAIGLDGNLAGPQLERQQKTGKALVSHRLARGST